MGTGTRSGAQAVELDPELSWGHSALGDLYALTGRLSEAKLSYLRAIDLNPSDTVALNDHSWAELLLGNYDESLYWSKRALPFAPNSPNFHSHVAWPLLALGDDAVTERWLTAAEERLPYHHRIQGGLALLDMLRRRDDAAIDRLRRAAERAPENVELQQWRAAFSIVARAENAGELVEAQFRITPEARMQIGMAPSFYTLYGDVLLRRGEETEAGQLLEQALSHSEEELAQRKDLPWIPMEIASIHALRGETEAALEWSERAYDAGFRDYRLLQRMPLLDSIRDHARFGELLARMEADVAEMRRRATERGLLDFD